MKTRTLIRTIVRTSVCAAVAIATTACIARSANDYRQVTRSMVDTQKGDIESCFAGQPGKVVVNFTVEKKTGKIANATIDDKKSNASAEVGQCVVGKIEGLALKDPEMPDMRDGAANFTWQLTN